MSGASNLRRYKTAPILPLSPGSKEDTFIDLGLANSHSMSEKIGMLSKVRRVDSARNKSRNLFASESLRSLKVPVPFSLQAAVFNLHNFAGALNTSSSPSSPVLS